MTNGSIGWYWSNSGWGAYRKFASFFSLAFAVILLAWLARGIIGIRAYADQLLLVAFASLLVSRILRTRTSMGLARAISSLFWNLMMFSIISIITLLLLSWAASLQGENLPAILQNQIPILALATIGLGLAASAFHQISPKYPSPKIERNPRLIQGNTKIHVGKISLATKDATIVFPVRRVGRNIGNIAFGEMQTQLDTPMGPVNMKIRGPYLIYGVTLEGQPATHQDTHRLTGKEVDELYEEATRIAPHVMGRLRQKSETVDLPFVHVHEDEMGSVVDLGPIHVEEGPHGEEVRIGPVTISSGKGSGFPKRWGIISHGNTSMIYAKGHSIWARWNGFSVRLVGDIMKYRAGEEGFEYSPNHVKTRSPMHLLRIGREHASLFTKDFSIQISADKVSLRTEGKTRSLDSPEVAGELRRILAEEAKRHIQNIMEGLPIELDTTFSEVEKILGKHLQ